jgi:hypothetical protein
MCELFAKKYKTHLHPIYERRIRRNFRTLRETLIKLYESVGFSSNYRCRDLLEPVLGAFKLHEVGRKREDYPTA